PTGSSTSAPAPATTAAGSSSRAHRPTSWRPAPPSPASTSPPTSINGEHDLAAHLAGLHLPVGLGRPGQREAPPDRDSQRRGGGEPGESGQRRRRAATAEPLDPVPGGGRLVDQGDDPAGVRDQRQGGVDRRPADRVE